MFNKQMALQPDAAMMDQMVVAFDTLAASPSLSLLHRYETRLHLMYQRALRTLIMLRTIDRPNEDPPNDEIPNDPSPISEHSPPAVEPPPPSQQSADSEALIGAANPGFQPALAPRRPPPRPIQWGQASWPVSSRSQGRTGHRLLWPVASPSVHRDGSPAPLFRQPPVARPPPGPRCNIPASTAPH
jgi:hypothetical protein